jgi:hypothetical protein
MDMDLACLYLYLLLGDTNHDVVHERIQVKQPTTKGKSMAVSKSTKFRIYAAKKSGRLKNKRLLVCNEFYQGGDNITLQNLIDFLKEKQINPSSVEIRPGFSTAVSTETS